jgi:hypothetical protein
MKRALLILSAFGYLMLLMEGTSTGLGVYRTPAYCFAAAACAGLAVVCASGRARWYWSIAAIAALGFGFYGYHKNGERRERLGRYQAQRSPPAIPAQTNK